MFRALQEAGVVSRASRHHRAVARKLPASGLGITPASEPYCRLFILARLSLHLHSIFSASVDEPTKAVCANVRYYIIVKAPPL